MGRCLLLPASLDLRVGRVILLPGKPGLASEPELLPASLDLRVGCFLLLPARLDVQAGLDLLAPAGLDL